MGAAVLIGSHIVFSGLSFAGVVAVLVAMLGWRALDRWGAVWMLRIRQERARAAWTAATAKLAAPMMFHGLQNSVVGSIEHDGVVVSLEIRTEVVDPDQPRSPDYRNFTTLHVDARGRVPYDLRLRKIVVDPTLARVLADEPGGPDELPPDIAIEGHYATGTQILDPATIAVIRRSVGTLGLHVEDGVVTFRGRGVEFQEHRALLLLGAALDLARALSSAPARTS